MSWWVNSPVSKASPQLWQRSLEQVMAGINDAEVNIIGDSTTYGMYGDATYSASVARQLNALLMGKLPVATGWVSLNSNTSNRDAFYWNIGASWNLPMSFGFGNSCGVKATDPANPITFTPDCVADAFDVMLIGATGYGSATLTATGGTPIVVNCNTTAQIIVATCYASSLSSENAVSITGTGQLIVIAVRARNTQKKQMYINNLGVGGSKASDWGDQAVTGWNSKAAMAKTSPCLSIVAVGINDALNSATATAFSTSLTGVVANINVGEVVFATPLLTNPSTQAASFALLKQYHAKLKTYCNSNSLKLIDIGGMIGPLTSTLSSDGIHPIASIYGVIAGAYADMLL